MNTDAIALTGNNAERAAVDSIVAPNQARAMIRQVRDMIDHIDNAPDAARLVHRANATEKVVNEALKSWQLLAEEQFELRQDAAEAHLRTQHRAGQLLAQLQKNAGGRPATSSKRKAGGRQRVSTLRELGVTMGESHRWRRVASLSSEEFDAYIEDRRRVRRELTTAGAVALANRIRRVQNGGSVSTSHAGSDALAAFKKHMGHVSNLFHLDPESLVAASGPDQLPAVTQTLRSLRHWLDAVERAIQTPDA